MRTYLAAVLLVACALSACDPSQDGPTRELRGGVELLSGSEVTIDPALRQCSTNSDCVLVWTGCDGCCQRQAINEDGLDAFRDGFQEACADYAGPVCDCVPAEQAAQCVSGTCEAVLVAD